MNDSIAESFVAFECDSAACLGVLAVPSSVRRAATVGLLVIVGGPQYRVGSHRQFVLLSRAVARAGFPAFRFDVRGMGDSDGPPRSFEAIDDDIRCSIDTLCDRAGVKRVVLWGLCDGATAALTYAPSDARVAGVVAANPWVRSPSLQAQVSVRSYYVQRLASRDFWSRLATGRISLASLADAGTAVRSQLGSAREVAPAFVERFERAWDRFEGDLLFVVSGRDYTAEEFLTWVEADAVRRKRLQRTSTTVDYLRQADHTFSSVDASLAVQNCTVRWLLSRHSA